MLREIGIKNFILIEDLRIELDSGLNVLTGETGAGKSILLDALGLLLGDRFHSEQVRQSAEKSSVDGRFEVPRTREFQAWWQEHGWDAGEEILIRREGYPDGRSKAYLNDQPVTLATLAELSSFLVDVHGQNEHQQILKPGIQLALLDRFAGLEEKRAALLPLFHRWKALNAELEADQLSETERLQRIDILRFQAEEIEKARPEAGEDEQLALRLPELKNADKLRGLAAGAYEALYEAEGSTLERLGQIEKLFDSLSQLAPAIGPLRQELVEAKIRLEEVARSLQSESERWSADPEALETSLTRLHLLTRLKEKYGSTLEAVIEHGSKLRDELSRLENADTYREQRQNELSAAEAVLSRASAELSTRRKRAAKELASAVKKELGELGMKLAQFECRVDSRTKDYGATGSDAVSFEWSANPGEPIQPLKTTASGGEMSRVMLALKSVLAEVDAVPSLVFDEIDAGVGGITAHVVGKKLRRLAKHRQVLCVSHLPQIASCASAHYQVSKRVSKSRTFAVIERLDGSQRVNELARLLGSEVSPISLRHAEELLAQNG
jgi:DNA repair protein RecN (Recombination protein N)